MDFQDFPMILGNLGVETDPPPKMCAGLGWIMQSRCSRQCKIGDSAVNARVCLQKRLAVRSLAVARGLTAQSK